MDNTDDSSGTVIHKIEQIPDNTHYISILPVNLVDCNDQRNCETEET